MRLEPAAGALELGHGAGLHEDASPGEAATEGALECGSERYLGHQNQDLPAALEDLGDELQVDLGLPAAGDAEEQAHLKFLQPAAQGVDGALLL